MTQDWTHPNQGPTPEQLAAYADGELEPSVRDWIEAWLADHPEASAEIEVQHQLMQLWQATLPPDLAPSDWEKPLARIDQTLSATVSTPAPSPSRRRLFPWVGGLTAAAALLGVVFLGRTWWSTQPVVVPRAGPSQAAREEPYPVADSEEFTIISMPPRDEAGLVVGQLPVRGPLEMATMDDIEVVAMEPDHPEGLLPSLAEGDLPMLVAPLVLAEYEDPEP